MPVPKLNPSRGQLLAELADYRRVTHDTEVVFHFLGHSVSRGAEDLELILKVEDGEDTTLPLSQLFETIARIPCGAVILILDTCHVGRAVPILDPIRDRSYAMMATGESWAYNADFSDALLRALEAPLRGKDQRIDRRAGGVTYAKLFQDATRRIVSAAGEPLQQPVAAGEMGARVIIEAPPVVTEGFSPIASSRTVYGRTFELLTLIHDRGEVAGLMAAVRDHPAFVLDTGTARTVSDARITDYLKFLRRVRWVVEPQGRLQLTAAGVTARDRGRFNRLLLEVIERHVLPSALGLERLDGIIKELLEDMIPPTPSRIRERAGMNGILLNLDPATRVALALLPTTGRFLKGSADAIYPYEPLGGE